MGKKVTGSVVVGTGHDPGSIAPCAIGTENDVLFEDAL